MRRHGSETEMGRKVVAAFPAAGRPAPTVLQESQIAGLPGVALDVQWLSMFASLIETLLPEIEHQGLITAEQVQVAPLVERISRETARTAGTITGPAQFGAWLRCSRGPICPGCTLAPVVAASTTRPATLWHRPPCRVPSPCRRPGVR